MNLTTLQKFVSLYLVEILPVFVRMSFELDRSQANFRTKLIRTPVKFFVLRAELLDEVLIFLNKKSLVFIFPETWGHKINFKKIVV